MTTGGSTCQCAGCGEYFAGVGPFDRHLYNSGSAHPRCRTADQMEGIGMKQNENGVWQYGRSLKEVEGD